MNSSTVFKSILKGVGITSIIGIGLVSISVIGYASYETFLVIKTAVSDYATEGDVVKKSLHAVDLYLLGIAIFIMSVGLFELFVSDIKGLPKWLVVKDLDQLKSMLVKIVIVVMSVSFTNKVVTWDEKTDLLGFGVGMGAVILALSYFLVVKYNGKETNKEEAPYLPQNGNPRAVEQQEIV
ncbi:MAG: YqhA family protein [Bacteroidota bacterium]